MCTKGSQLTQGFCQTNLHHALSAARLHCEGQQEPRQLHKVDGRVIGACAEGASRVGIERTSWQNSSAPKILEILKLLLHSKDFDKEINHIPLFHSWHQFKHLSPHFPQSSSAPTSRTFFGSPGVLLRPCQDEGEVLQPHQGSRQRMQRSAFLQRAVYWQTVEGAKLRK